MQGVTLFDEFTQMDDVLIIIRYIFSTFSSWILQLFRLINSNLLNYETNDYKNGETIGELFEKSISLRLLFFI